MSIGRRVVLGCCRWSTACGVLLIWAAPVVLIIFALLLPANAQYWGNSWSGRQQQSQQPYNPYGGYGGYGHDRQWDNWGYRQRERAAPLAIMPIAAIAAVGIVQIGRAHV